MKLTLTAALLCAATFPAMAETKIILECEVRPTASGNWFVKADANCDMDLPATGAGGTFPFSAIVAALADDDEPTDPPDEEEPPVDDDPVDEPPVDEPPADDPPAEDPPGDGNNGGGNGDGDGCQGAGCDDPSNPGNGGATW